MNNKEFFGTMYQGLDKGFVPLWDKQTKQTKFYEIGNLDNLIADAEQRVKEGKDAYFSVCPLAHPLEQGRGTEADVGVITTLFADIDIADGVHKSGKNYPETVEKALELLAPFPKPSILVHSGGGLHAYWLLDKPFIIQNEEDRAAAKKLLSGFQNALISEFGKHGYSMDHTGDLARVLRVPGTLNFKDPERPKDVKIIACEEPVTRYAPEQFPQCDGVAKIKTKTNEADSDGLVEGDVNVIVRRCPFIQHCIAEAATLREKLWHAAIDNLALVNGSEDFIHAMSRPYPEYTVGETNEKIGHAREKPAPHTCRFIQGEKIGFKGCPPGGCPVEAPVGWLSRKGLAYDRVLSLLEKDKLSRQDVWANDVQEALVEIKQYSESDYRGLLQRVREKVPDLGIRDFKVSIEDRSKKRMQRLLEISDDQVKALSQVLGYEVTFPPSYFLDDHGQILYNSGLKTDVVAYQPLGIASRYVNRARETLDELVFQRQDSEAAWMRLLVRPQYLASIHKIIELSNYGLLVDATKSASLVSFMTNFKKSNGDNIKTVRFTSRLGWQEDGSFFPGLSEYRFIREGNVSDDTDQFLAKGELADWMRIAGPARQYPGTRLALAVSFAAPLLKLIDCRTFVVHLWGPSQSGKTAAQVLASSVWLDPFKAMISFNATKVGLERHLGYFSNLPVIINERQVVGDNQQLIEALVYMMGEGQGRTRGTRMGTVQRGEQWTTIILTSGEHPLSSYASAGGVKTRALEPYFEKVIEDTGYAASLYSECSKSFGTAGPAFLKTLIEQAPKIGECLAYWSGLVKEGFEKLTGSHHTYLAIIAATDYLTSVYLWGKTEDEAMAETQEFVKFLSQAIKVTGETEELHRMRAFVEGWITQYDRHFSEVAEGKYQDQGVNGDRYGWFLPEGNVGIVPTVFYKALATNGFNWDRLKIEFAKQGWLKTGTDRGAVDYTPTRNIPGQGNNRLIELVGFRRFEVQPACTNPPEITNPPECEIGNIEENGKLLDQSA